MSLYEPYQPLSSMPRLDTVVPENLATPTMAALQRLRERVGDVDSYVCERLKMTADELRGCLSAEQTDGVALAIANIEQKRGLIIGDQTGLGKGRQAAAVIRYAILNGYFPIFFTAKKNLFSDIYRDLKALDAHGFKPFFLNSGAKMVDYSVRINFDHDYAEDEEPSYDDYLVAHASDDKLCRQINSSGADEHWASEILTQFDYMVSTYSQLNQRSVLPRQVLISNMMSQGRAIVILDEAHEASGQGNTGKNLREIVRESYGCLYLTATFAKRVDNLMLYAPKTRVGQYAIDDNVLQKALLKGGLPMQECMAAQLVASGQMLRREKDFRDVEVRYEVLTDSAECDTMLYDRVAEVLGWIRDYRETLMPIAQKITSIALHRLLRDASARGRELDIRKGMIDKVRLCTVFGTLHIVAEALTLALKAEGIARECIREVRAGNKVVVALSKTAEAALRTLRDADGRLAKPGAAVRASFNSVLVAMLDRVSRFENISDDVREYFEGYIDADNCIAVNEGYAELKRRIQHVDLHLPLSPIDVILERITRAGIRVEECTSRQTCVHYTDDEQNAIFDLRPKVNTDWVYNEFQNNRIDVMIINATGALGASAHAVPTASVPEAEVRRRVMIIAQPELNVSMEIQKRGRINRIGQLPSLPPKFVYVSSVVPHEHRTLMMLKRKLKSLDANTSAFQEQSRKHLDCVDFYNKYGDAVVCDWLSVNPDLDYKKLGIPRGSGEGEAGAALKTSARVAILTCAEQERFYAEVCGAYEAKIKMLDEEGRNDLEMQTNNWQAELIKRELLMLTSYDDPSANVYLSWYRCRMPHLPYSFDEVASLIRTHIADFDPAKRETYHIRHEGHAVVDFYCKKMDDYENRRESIGRDERIQLDNMQRDCDRVTEVLTYFYVGRYVRLRIEDDEVVDAIVVGRTLGRSADTRYQASHVEINFAVAHHSRMRSYNCFHNARREGGYVRLHEAIEMSDRLYEDTDTTRLMGDNRKRWVEQSRQWSMMTQVMPMLTGNLLSAYTSEWAAKGLRRMTAFVDSEGRRQYGVIMPPKLAEEFDKQPHIDIPLMPTVTASMLREISEECELTGVYGPVKVVRRAEGLELSVWWWHKAMLSKLLTKVLLPAEGIEEQGSRHALMVPWAYLENTIVFFASMQYALRISKEYAARQF